MKPRSAAAKMADARCASPTWFAPLREVGDWQGKALHISETFPDGEDAAVIVQAPDGRIVGAARL